MLDNLHIIRKAVKHANLKVKPNLDVILTVPTRTTQTEINHILATREDWILAKLEHFKKYQVIAKELVNGEDFHYLGCDYQLKVIGIEEIQSLTTSAVKMVESVELIGEFLHIYVKNKTDIQKKLYLIDEWYKEQAQQLFLEILAKYAIIVGREVNKISIRRMRTRWGSCNPKKAYINLNLDLIKKHICAIEYVIFHELTHLIHYNHDKNFYNYIATYMPDWKARKKFLYIS